MNTHAIHDSPKIGIIIPVFNRIKLTTACLESLKNVLYPNVEIIIVDDGSTDGTSEIIKNDYPYVVIVKGDGNLWWAKATNMGIEKAILNNCHYVLFLNNDDEVDELILNNLMECARDNPESIIGCKVRDFDQPDKLIFAGGDCDWKNKGLLTYGYGEIDTGQYDLRKEIKWIPGAGTFVRADLFGEIGFIDDRIFPHYAADIDFTLRAYEAGYKIIFEPKAILYKKMGDNGSSATPKYSLFKKFVLPLFSIRSSVNLPLQARFLWRHCPKRLIPRMLIHKYFTYYKGFLSLGSAMRYLKGVFNKG